MKMILLSLILFFAVNVTDSSAAPSTLCWDLSRDKALWVDGLNGLDSNDGLSEGTAFKTIQKAYDNLTADSSNWYKHVFIKASASYDLTTPLVFNVAKAGAYGYTTFSGYSSQPGDGGKAIITDLGNIGMSMIVTLSNTGTNIIFNSLDMSLSGTNTTAVIQGTYNGGEIALVDCTLRSPGPCIVTIYGGRLRVFNSYLYSLSNGSIATRLYANNGVFGVNSIFWSPTPNSGSTLFWFGNGSLIYNCYVKGSRYLFGYSAGFAINCTLAEQYSGFYLSNGGIYAIVNCVIEGCPGTTTTWGGFSYPSTHFLIEGGNVIDTANFSDGTNALWSSRAATDVSTTFDIDGYTARPHTYNRGTNYWGAKMDSGPLQDTSYMPATTEFRAK